MSADWQLKTAGDVEYFEYSPDPHLLLAFFGRGGGVSRGQYESLNTSFAVGDDAQNVKENLARARRALGLPSIVTVKQTHSDKVLVIGDERTPSDALEADACITDRAGFGLGLKVADCLPVYIYSAHSDCIGIAHCGWRGTAARLAEKTARQMSRRFRVPLPDLRFALGPCICSSCYEVGDDVLRAFSKSFPLPDRFLSRIETPTARPEPQTRHEITHCPTGAAAAKATKRIAGKGQSSVSSDFVSSWPSTPGSGPKYHLDIRAANRWLLDEVGLLETNCIERCTFENDGLFYSARRDKTTGRNLAVIALR